MSEFIKLTKHIPQKPERKPIYINVNNIICIISFSNFTCIYFTFDQCLLVNERPEEIFRMINDMERSEHIDTTKRFVFIDNITNEVVDSFDSILEAFDALKSSLLDDIDDLDIQLKDGYIDEEEYNEFRSNIINEYSIYDNLTHNYLCLEFEGHEQENPENSAIKF